VSSCGGSALGLMHLPTNVLHLESVIGGGKRAMLSKACLAGLVPEPGPHLIFVRLFAQGVVRSASCRPVRAPGTDTAGSPCWHTRYAGLH
jgi:hypothetical protein